MPKNGRPAGDLSLDGDPDTSPRMTTQTEPLGFIDEISFDPMILFQQVNRDLVSGWRDSPFVSDALGSLVSSMGSPSSQGGSSPLMFERKKLSRRRFLVGAAAAVDTKGLGLVVVNDRVLEDTVGSARLGAATKVGLTDPLATSSNGPPPPRLWPRGWLQSPLRRLESQSWNRESIFGLPVHDRLMDFIRP